MSLLEESIDFTRKLATSSRFQWKSTCPNTYSFKSVHWTLFILASIALNSLESRGSDAFRIMIILWTHSIKRIVWTSYYEVLTLCEVYIERRFRARSSGRVLQFSSLVVALFNEASLARILHTRSLWLTTCETLQRNAATQYPRCPLWDSHRVAAFC